MRLRSVVRALLSMVPVLIATGAASLVAWAFDLQLSPMTAVGGPLIVALCTEFTSLILLRFIEERQRGYSPRDAVSVTAARTGRAFIVSALTAISGVAVIAFSSLPLLQRLRPDRGHERGRRPRSQQRKDLVSRTQTAVHLDGR